MIVDCGWAFLAGVACGVVALWVFLLALPDPPDEW